MTNVFPPLPPSLFNIRDSNISIGTIPGLRSFVHGGANNRGGIHIEIEGGEAESTDVSTHTYAGRRCVCACVQLLPLILDPRQGFWRQARVVSSTIARLQSRRKQFRLLSSSIKPKRNGHGIESVFCQGNCRRIRGKIARDVCFHPVKGMEIGERGREGDCGISILRCRWLVYIDSDCGVSIACTSMIRLSLAEDNRFASSRRLKDRWTRGALSRLCYIFWYWYARFGDLLHLTLRLWWFSSPLIDVRNENLES